MPSLQIFDRLSALNTSNSSGTIRSIPINRYFNEMDLTPRQKKERISLANDIEDAMLFFFALVIAQREYAYMAGISALDLKDQFRKRMEETVSRHTELTDELREYINEYVDDVTKTTTEHLEILLALMGDTSSVPDESEKQRRQAEEFYLSDDRARLLGEEEANTIFNGVDFRTAKALGYKRKEWVSMKDNRVRLTHQEVDSRVIPINELFVVGNSVMRYPRDLKYSPSPKEYILCRCTIKYYK